MTECWLLILHGTEGSIPLVCMHDESDVYEYLAANTLDELKLKAVTAKHRWQALCGEVVAVVLYRMFGCEFLSATNVTGLLAE